MSVCSDSYTSTVGLCWIQIHCVNLCVSCRDCLEPMSLAVQSCDLYWKSSCVCNQACKGGIWIWSLEFDKQNIHILYGWCLCLSVSVIRYLKFTLANSCQLQFKNRMSTSALFFFVSWTETFLQSLLKLEEMPSTKLKMPSNIRYRGNVTVP